MTKVLWHWGTAVNKICFFLRMLLLLFSMVSLSIFVGWSSFWICREVQKCNDGLWLVNQNLHAVLLLQFKILLPEGVDTINHGLDELDLRVSKTMFVGNVIGVSYLTNKQTFNIWNKVTYQCLNFISVPTWNHINAKFLYNRLDHMNYVWICKLYLNC